MKLEVAPKVICNGVLTSLACLHQKVSTNCVGSNTSKCLVLSRVCDAPGLCKQPVYVWYLVDCPPDVNWYNIF